MSKGTILVTGGSGYVGGHIIREALERGYDVRAVVRTDGAGKKLLQAFQKFGGHLTYVVIPDITAIDSYKGQFSGVTAIVHTASPFILDIKDNEKDMLEPAVNMSRAILEAAKNYGTPALKRVVVTSSLAAIMDLTVGLGAGITWTEKEWNPATWEQAAAAGGGFTYAASKGLAERAMWDWIKENNPSFDLVAMTPPWIFGPYAWPLTDTKSLGESIGAVYSSLDSGKVRDPDFNSFVDVRDIAEAHITALEKPEAGGQRFLVGQNFNWQMAHDAVRAEGVPEINSRLVEGTPGKWPDTYKVDGSKATKVLGIKYTPLGKTFKDTYLQLFEAEKAQAAA